MECALIRLPILLLSACALFAAPAWADPAVGFQRLALPDAQRPLQAVIWYPAADTGTTTLVADTRALIGTAVEPGAPALPGHHPLLLLSHGYGGNWGNEMWLAADLVRQGYIVAAVNHPGTTTHDLHASDSALSERPHDISRVIDTLTADAAWAPLIDDERIAAAGHSLGGWTVMELAGARFDARRFVDDCNVHPQLAACDHRNTNARPTAETQQALGRSFRDPRIKAVVSLDLGLSRGFDPASLAAITVPVLVIGEGAGNPKMPVELESRAMAALLPAATTRYVEIADAAHFTFLPLCKPGAAALLDKDVPGDGIICDDRGGRDRIALHRQIADLVSGFLTAALHLPPHS